MRTFERYEIPAVVPGLQEYEWRDHRRDIERDAIVMRIDTNHLPPLPGREPVEPVRKDN
jgi:hypothetical protein